MGSGTCSATTPRGGRQLEARQPTPLLIGDDLLVERGTRPIQLSGATIAEFADGRITSLRTYFDDAALIEQVILDR